MTLKTALVDYNTYLENQIRQSAATRQFTEYQNRCKAAILKCARQWQSNSYVLEVGCGDGFTLDILRELNFSCAGIDINPDKIEVAKQFGHDVYCVDAAIGLPFDGNCFDVVYCRYTLEHILKPKEMLQEIRRVLKSDGLLSLIVPIVTESQIGTKHVLAIPNKEFVAELLNTVGFEVRTNSEYDKPGGREVWTLAQNKKQSS